jgi:hypothetical protein
MNPTPKTGDEMRGDEMGGDEIDRHKKGDY